MTLHEAIAQAIADEVAALVLERFTESIAHLSDPVFRPKQAAAYLGISERSLDGLALPKVHPTPGTTGYRLSVLNSHLK